MIAFRTGGRPAPAWGGMVAKWLALFAIAAASAALAFYFLPDGLFRR